VKRVPRALDGLDDDIREHIERETQDNLDRGLSADEARRQALVKFGNVALVKSPPRLPFFGAVLDSAKAVPGVESAALTIHVPMGDRPSMGWDAVPEGREYNPVTDDAAGRIVSPGYFPTVGIRIVEGRDFGYRVAQRMKEIAIRVALGAPYWHVTAAVLRDTVTSVGFGLAAGVLLALAAASSIRSHLFGIEARDGMTFVTACTVVVTAALLAAYLPARRAQQVDPITALRVE
jgi:FtsX-like permease family